MPQSTSLDLLRRLDGTSAGVAWQSFLEIYEPFIDRQLRGFGLQPSDVNDVRQDVMCVLVSEIQQFEHNGNKGAFRTWLRRIVANQLKRHFRKRLLAGRRVEQAFTNQASQLVDDCSELSVRWETEHQRYLIHSLIERVACRFDPITMLAFHRQFIDDATPADVAAELERSTDAVIAAKYRVMKALREVKQECFGFLCDD